MKKYLHNRVLFAVSLILLSALCYWIHYLVFKDSHHIFMYLVGDIAFVFIEVLMVTMILHELLERREKHHRREKLNVIVGLFFREAGTPMLKLFQSNDTQVDTLRQKLQISSNWNKRDFAEAHKSVKRHDFSPEISREKMQKLRSQLVEKNDFFLRLLENPNLLDHEEFTNLLHAVCHLENELSLRQDLATLPEEDFKHLSGDVNRVYSLLVPSWIKYNEYLKHNYPYLFSLEERTNPFNESAKVEIS